MQALLFFFFSFCVFVVCVQATSENHQVDSDEGEYEPANNPVARLFSSIRNNNRVRNSLRRPDGEGVPMHGPHLPPKQTALQGFVKRPVIPFPDRPFNSIIPIIPKTKPTDLTEDYPLFHSSSVERMKIQQNLVPQSAEAKLDEQRHSKILQEALRKMKEYDQSLPERLPTVEEKKNEANYKLSQKYPQYDASLAHIVDNQK